MSRLLCALLMFCLIAPGATAQVRIAGVSAGWNDVLAGDAWNAVRVTVEGGDTPFQGEIIIDTINRGRTLFRAARPFAIAPGATTTFETPVRPPMSAMQFYQYGHWTIDVRLVRSSRTVDKWTSMPRGSRVPLITVDGDRDAGDFVLFVTDASTPSYAVPNTYQPDFDFEGRRATAIRNNNEVLGRWFSSAPLEVDAGVLPRTAQLYESVGTVVLHARLLPRLSGARREALIGWVRDGGWLVVLGDATEIDTDFRPIGVRTDESPVVVDGFTLERTAWPLGLGAVSHLPEQPADVATDPTARMALWLEVFAAPPAVPARGDRWMYYRDEPSNDAVDFVVQYFDEVQPPSVAWLFLFMGLLALCVGPLDRLILKRTKMLHRSWASALGWIALASGIALVVPPLVTSGGSQAGAFERIDVAPDGHVYAERTYAIYASSAHDADLTPEGSAAGVWQHTIQHPAMRRNLFTPETIVGDGAVVPRTRMRPRTLLGVHEIGPADVPLGVDVVADRGRAAIEVKGEAPFDLYVAELWTRDGVHLASVDSRERGATSATLPLAAPIDASDYTPNHVGTELLQERAPRNRWRTPSKLIEAGEVAYAVIVARYEGGPPVPGAPESAGVSARVVTLRIPVELDDAARAALAAPRDDDPEEDPAP